MSASPEKKDASARSPLAGCVIMIVLMMVMVFLIGFSTWALFRQADEIAKFTVETPKPLEVTSLEGRDADVNTLHERMEGFRQSLDREDTTKLELSADDLNLAIAAFAPLSEMRSTFRIREIREDGKMVADISLKMNGKPRRAREGETGFISSDFRYLNGTLITRPELAQGEVLLRIDSIEVPGAAVPDQFREQMSPYRITERYKEDPVLGPAMKKLTSLKVEGGKIVLRKTPGEIPPDTITHAQVDAASSRLFKWLGIAASLFLVLVGFLLFIGMRAKKRKAQM